MRNESAVTPLLETRRLALHPFEMGDLPLLAELHGDAEVMRYLTADGQPWPEAVLRQKLGRFVTEYERHGLGRWKVLRRADGGFVGRAGFSPCPPTGDLELGFIFKQDCWGQGYATECAAALLAWLFRERSETDHVIAFARPDNLASRRVLEKVGMRPTGRRPVDGVPFDFYRMNRE